MASSSSSSSTCRTAIASWARWSKTGSSTPLGRLPLLRASTSFLSSTPLSFLPSSTSSFHSSAPNFESRRRRKVRFRKQANLIRHIQKRQHDIENKPSPIRGYGKGNEKLWKESDLNKVLLNKDDVWGLGPDGKFKESEVEKAAAEAEGAAGGATTVKAGLSAAELAALSANHPGVTGKVTPPEHLNYLLPESARQLLFEDLPAVSAQHSSLRLEADSALAGAGPVQRSMGGGREIKDALSESHSQTQEMAIRTEMEKAGVLARILDLRNSNSRGIRVENTRRIVELFGRKPGDTGSPDVQAAILTCQIHNCADALLANRRDIHNRRNLRRLISQRAKLLKYLKRTDPLRYAEVLPKMGLDPKSVEGELVFRIPGKAVVNDELTAFM